MQVGEHTELLGPGDTIYYDSATPHGMAAVGGVDCLFYAIVLNPGGEPLPELAERLTPDKEGPIKAEQRPTLERRVWEDFIIPEENGNGALLSLAFKNENYFNFAFDVVDELAKSKPDKLAMLHVGRDKTERRFTSRISAATVPGPPIISSP